MTTFDALVSMSILALRARGHWDTANLSYEQIDAAVNACADLLRGDDKPDLVSLDQIEMALREIITRASYRFTPADLYDRSPELEAAHGPECVCFDCRKERQSRAPINSPELEAAHERRQLGSYGR